MRVSEIRVKRIRVNQGLGVHSFMTVRKNNVLLFRSKIHKKYKYLTHSIITYNMDCILFTPMGTGNYGVSAGIPSTIYGKGL